MTIDRLPKTEILANLASILHITSDYLIGNDIKYMPEKLDQASNFANKIWNAAKFVLMNLTDANEKQE